MRLASYIHDGRPGWGYINEREEICAVTSYSGKPVPTLRSFIEAGLGSFEPRLAGPEGVRPVKLGDVTLTAPVPDPARNILCVGKNYFDHIAEFDRKSDKPVGTPAQPAYFTKATCTVNGPYSAIPSHPGVTAELDYEAELAVVIGRRGVNIKPEDAIGYIFGYTCLNDVTARDLQRDHLQWFKGKSLDGFCPMGPWIVTADALAEPGRLDIRSTVNGEVRQDSNTSKMIFDVATLISVLSQGFTLLPGDVIATGTPSGVGMGFDPPKLLKRGDTVTVEIEGIGKLINRVE